MKTIDYYNNNSKASYDRTINADITDSYEKFLKYLPEKAKILDAGCGVGRDTKYFLSKGHAVNAFDASEKMVELAFKETGVRIMHSTFLALNFENMFDGVWAQASLLHIPYDMTQGIYQKIHESLKLNGIFYASYKYGDSYMETPERDFYNMNENKVMQYFEGLFNVIELWQKKDIRSKVAPSPEGMWLNFIVRKI
jgi:SAM-dependent methyltransferase